MTVNGRVVVTLVALSLLFFLSCQERAFTNPYDDELQLDTPQQFTINSFTDTTITFAWSNAVKHATGYVLEFSYYEDKYTSLDTLPASASNTTINFTIDYTRYYYFRLRAITHVSSSEGALIGGIKFTAGTLTGVTVVAGSNSKLTLHWTDPDYQNSQYRIRLIMNDATVTDLTTAKGVNRVELPIVLDTNKVYQLQIQSNPTTKYSRAYLYALKWSPILVCGGSALFEANGKTARLFTLCNNTLTLHNWFSTVKTAVYYNNFLYVGGKYFYGVSKFGNGYYDGEYWQGLQYYSDAVRHLTVYNGKLLIAGMSDYPAMQFSRYLCHWDGVNYIPLTNGPKYYVNTTAVFQGKLIAGGEFTETELKRADHIAYYLNNEWFTMQEGLNGNVHALCVYNNELYAGGEFTVPGSTNPSGIAKWNGNKWVTPSFEIQGVVRALHVWNGMLYIGGSFSNTGSDIANLAAFDGSKLLSIGAFNGEIYAISGYNGALYVGGGFTFTSGSQLIENLGFYDGTWHPLIKASSGIVYVINSGNKWTII